MNWTMTRSNNLNYVRVNLTGLFCMAGARSVTAKILSKPFWNNGTSILIDNRQVDMGDVNTADIECLTIMMKSLNERISKSKIALVGNTDIQFGFARQFQIKAEQNTTANIRVFRCESAAIEWITNSTAYPYSPYAPSTAELPGIAFGAQAAISNSVYL